MLIYRERYFKVTLEGVGLSSFAVSSTHLSSPSLIPAAWVVTSCLEDGSFGGVETGLLCGPASVSTPFCSWDVLASVGGHSVSVGTGSTEISLEVDGTGPSHSFCIFLEFLV